MYKPSNRPTNTQTHKQTHRQDRLKYTAPQLARSVKSAGIVSCQTKPDNLLQRIAKNPLKRQGHMPKNMPTSCRRQWSYPHDSSRSLRLPNSVTLDSVLLLPRRRHAESLHLLLIKFRLSCAPGAKIFGSALLQPARSVCVSSKRFFHIICVILCITCVLWCTFVAS